jgi:ribosomal protein S3
VADSDQVSMRQKTNRKPETVQMHGESIMLSEKKLTTQIGIKRTGLLLGQSGKRITKLTQSDSR